MAFKDELFSKIGASDEKANTEPLTLIKEGDQAYQNGDVGVATTNYENAVKYGLQRAEKFAAQKQYRSSAESYYLASIANLRLNRKEEAESLYVKVGEQLLEAANMYLNVYSEYTHGALCASLGGMIYILKNDFNKAKEVYQSNLNVVEEKANKGEIQVGKENIVQILWALGYMLKALEETSHDALQESQRLISTQIKPLMNKAKLGGIQPLLDQVIDYTVNHFESKIKLPELIIATDIPKDLVINQMFDFKLYLRNDGEGVASSVKVTLDFPENLDVVDGGTEYIFEKMEPEQGEELALHLRYQTPNSEDVKVRFSGRVTYQDMLNNTLVKYFGPFTLEINAESKRDKLTREINQMLQNADTIATLSIHEVYPTDINESLKQIEEDLFNALREQVDKENFESVPVGMDLVNIIQKSLAEIFGKEGAVAKVISEDVTKKMEEYADKKAEAVAAQKDKEKEAALAELTEIKEKERKAALETLKEKHEEAMAQLRADLERSYEEEKLKIKEQHEKEIRELEEKHKIEMEELNSKHKDEMDKHTAMLERKMNQRLADQEDNLRQEFNRQLSEVNDKNMETINELRKQFEDEQKETIKVETEKIKEQYERRIKELTDEYEEKLRRTREQLQEESNLKIEQLNKKHEQELAILREDYEMKLKEKQSQ